MLGIMYNMERKNIWIWILFLALGVILFLYLGRIRYPSQYDCLKLGSDKARASCLLRYHPDVAGCKEDAEFANELRLGLCENKDRRDRTGEGPVSSDYDFCTLQSYIELQDEKEKCLPVIQ